MRDKSNQESGDGKGGAVISDTIRPFFCFYGGKWRTAKRYPAPTRGLIIEPFAGAAGYALCHHKRSVILVERDPTIASVWRFLLSATSDDVLGLPDLDRGQTVDDVDASLGARRLIGFWLNKGAAHPCKSPSAWMRSGVRPNSFWGPQVRQRIASQLKHIRHWHLIEGDGVGVMESLSNLEATWFVDPPYADKGRHYRFSDVDYDRLAAACLAAKGQVVACEQDGADWLPFTHLVDAKANHATKTSAEAVFVRTTTTGEKP